MTGVEDSNLQSRRYSPPVGFGQNSSKLTVLCDFDGPLVDVSDRYYNTYQLSLADTQAAYQAQGISLPLQALSKTQFWQLKQERVPDIEIAVRSGLQSEQIDFFLDRVRQVVNQPTLLQNDVLQPGVRWALALLHSRGVQLAVVSLRCKVQVQQILQSYELDHLFSAIYGTDDETAAYQNSTEVKRQLLGQALAESSCSQQDRVWMIGDTEADVLAGQSLGISTIGVTRGIRSALYLKRLKPTRLHSDLLSAAHYLVELSLGSPKSLGLSIGVRSTCQELS